jgi:extracellular elastinolytic metalloproteinase
MKLYQAATILSSLSAAPLIQDNHQLQLVDRNGVKFPYYYPKPTIKKFSPQDKPLPMNREESFKFGREQLVKELNIKDSDLKITSQYEDASGTVHIYAVRTYGGVPVSNNNAAIHIKDGQVQSISHSFSLAEPPKYVTRKRISFEEAVKAAEFVLSIKRDDFPEQTVFIQVPSGDLVEAYQFQMRDSQKAKFYQVSVDKYDGQMIQVVDYVRKASYKGVPLNKHNPNDGMEFIKDPEDLKASPRGWVSDGKKKYKETKGNNVVSMIKGKTVGASNNAGDFDSQFDPSKDFDSTENQRAATINNFFCILALM